jgi:hypothetical protein
MAVYPYCWVWCCLRGDFAMFERAVADETPPEACYFDERLGRWVLFFELPADERARILDPCLWDQIEALRRRDAPTRKDVGLGPSSLAPAVLAALSHRGAGHGWGRPRRRPPNPLAPPGVRWS